MDNTRNVDSFKSYFVSVFPVKENYFQAEKCKTQPIAKKKVKPRKVEKIVKHMHVHQNPVV